MENEIKKIIDGCFCTDCGDPCTEEVYFDHCVEKESEESIWEYIASNCCGSEMAKVKIIYMDNSYEYDEKFGGEETSKEI